MHNPNPLLLIAAQNIATMFSLSPILQMVRGVSDTWKIIFPIWKVGKGGVSLRHMGLHFLVLLSIYVPIFFVFLFNSIPVYVFLSPSLYLS